MKSLFLRIFLSFWATLALFLVLAILVTIAMRPARRGVESAGPQILAEAVNAYQNRGERATFDYIEELQARISLYETRTPYRDARAESR